MRTGQDIVFGVAGQVLVFDAPEGRPSSVTSVEVFAADATDDDAEDAITGLPAIESTPNTVTDRDCGPSQAYPRVVPVAATTGGAIGRVLLVTDSDGRKEWIEVSEVDSGISFSARHPLHNDFAIGSTVQSTRITATVDTDWCSDESTLGEDGPAPHYRVRWVYVVAGVTYVADTYFSVVRYAGRHNVRPQDVDLVCPGWMDRLPTDHRGDSGQRLIDDAYRSVKLDLYTHLLDDANLADAEVVDELVRYRAIERCEFARFLSATNADPSRHEAAKQEYGDRFKSLIAITRPTPTRDSSGAASVGPPRRLSIR